MHTPLPQRVNSVRSRPLVTSPLHNQLPTCRCIATNRRSGPDNLMQGKPSYTELPNLTTKWQTAIRFSLDFLKVADPRRNPYEQSEKLQLQLLLWCGLIHSHRRARRHGLLPLHIMPPMVRGSSECLHVVEAREREGHAWRTKHRHLQQDVPKLSQMVQDLLRPHLHRASWLGSDGRLRRRHSRFFVQTWPAREL
jgi:hypothetical protein